MQLAVSPELYFPVEQRLQEVEAEMAPYRPAPQAVHEVAAEALYLPVWARCRKVTA
jgi:hypothetical protein